MSNDNIPNSNGGGIGVAGLLGVVFVTLKLCGVIDWSWWWVTCPFWGPLAVILTILGITLGIPLLISLGILGVHSVSGVIRKLGKK